MNRMDEAVMEGKNLGAVYSLPVGARLQVQGAALTPTRRAELKAKLRAGTLDELCFSAVTFRDGPNANHTRFREQELTEFAQSFAGVPFLRNHDTQDIGARDGTVVASRLVQNPGFGGMTNFEFHQTVRLTTERGMRDFLEGVIDRFSIGWYFERVECGICGEDWFGCGHWPGQRYRVEGGRMKAKDEGRRMNVEGREPSSSFNIHPSSLAEEQVCEVIFVGPRGKETSAVNAPAVPGTRVIEQLCMLKRQPALGAELANEEARMTVGAGAIVLPDGSLKQVAPLATNGNGSDMVAELRAQQAQLERERVAHLIGHSGLSEEGQAAVTLASQDKSVPYVAHLIEAQRRAEAALLGTQIVRGIRPVTESMMTTPQDRVQAAPVGRGDVGGVCA